MTAGKLSNLWALITIFLVAIIAIGSTIIWSKYSPGQPIEISIAPDQELQGEINIDGAVNNPSLYPLKGEDNLNDILRVAGGITDSADLSRLKLHIPETGDVEQPQKINLNLAEAWLLEALPGIGEVRAQAIIDYRQKNGQFRNVNELLNVEGIGPATYEKIKHLLTVSN